MLPLTSDTWSGLRLFRCGHDDEIRQFDVDVDTARLLFWNSGGTEVLIRSGRSKCRHFSHAAGPARSLRGGDVRRDPRRPTLTEVLVAVISDSWLPVE
jgi:hypothetical protein